MDVEARIRKLQIEFQCQAVVVAVLLIWVSGNHALGWLRESSTQVHLQRHGNTVRFISTSDGPYVITHLTVNGRDAGSERDKRVAALPKPLACIDSSGVTIQDITKLEWKDAHGESASVPDESVQLSALLLRPEYVQVPRN